MEETAVAIPARIPKPTVIELATRAPNGTPTPEDSIRRVVFTRLCNASGVTCWE